MRDLLERHEILNSASAIAFQVLFALVPLGLFTFALAGFLDLDRVWEDAAAELRDRVSPAAFTVIDDTAQRVLGGQQVFWLTAGALLALWRLSAAMRATTSNASVTPPRTFSRSSGAIASGGRTSAVSGSST